MPLARLTIVGDGPLRNEVESAVLARDLHDAVTFTGWLDPAGVDRQLETAWALVAPSMWAEPLGMVGPEAVIRSVPVIASSTGGFAETIEDEVSGLLFPNGDELALHRALERVATGAAFPSHSLDPGGRRSRDGVVRASNGTSPAFARTCSISLTAAGWIEQGTVIRFDHLNYQLHQTRCSTTC